MAFASSGASSVPGVPGVSDASGGAGGAEWARACDAAALHAKNAIGRGDLEELERELRGAGGVQAALARMRLAHRQSVICVVSSHSAQIFSTRDTVAARVLGERWAQRAFQLISTRAFIVLITVSTALASSALPLCATGRFDPYVTLGFFVAFISLFGMCCAVLFTRFLLSKLLRRFELWFLFGHTLAVAVGGFMLFDNTSVGAVWLAMYLVIMPLGLLYDSSLARRNALPSYILWSASLLGMLCGLFFKAFAVHQVTFPMFGDIVSVNDRVYASLLVCSAYLCRFAVTALVYPDGFALLRGLRVAKVPRAAAEAFIATHQARTREIVRLASAASAERLASAPRPAPRLLSFGGGGGARLPPVLVELVQAAQREAGDDDARARALLGGLFARVSGEGRAERRSTDATVAALKAVWGSSSAGNELVRLVAPRFVPLLLDRSSTIAHMIGGAAFHKLAYATSRSRLFTALTITLIPAGYSFFFYVLSWQDPNGAMPVFMFSSAAIMLNMWQSLLLNTAVITRIALRSWDVWFGLVNVLTVALTGAFIFTEPLYGRIWVVCQLAMSTFFFQDAAPPSKRARRINSVAMAFYGAFHVYAVFAIWLRVFAVRDYNVEVLGVRVNLKHTCFGAQVNVAILSVRYAIRALTDLDRFIFIDGLRRVSLPAADAAELRTVALAERAAASTRSQARVAPAAAPGAAVSAALSESAAAPGAAEPGPLSSPATPDDSASK